MKNGITTLRAGFTMVELLVVIVILGVLVAAFATSASGARETAMITRATAESRELGNAIRLFCMAQMDLEMNATDPISELGLSDGVRDANSTLTSVLTEPSSRNGNTVYYSVSQSSLRNNRICDPWGEPYQIRVRRVAGEAQQDEDYTLIVPVPARHRALEPLN